jgi:hypothetical protein
MDSLLERDILAGYWRVNRKKTRAAKEDVVKEETSSVFQGKSTQNFELRQPRRMEGLSEVGSVLRSMGNQFNRLQLID